MVYRSTILVDEWLTLKNVAKWMEEALFDRSDGKHKLQWEQLMLWTELREYGASDGDGAE